MTPALKKLCVFGLATGLGNIILQQVDTYDLTDIERKITIWNAKNIQQAGQKAIDACHVKVDRSMIKRVKKKIDSVCENGNEFDVLEMLSFLFLGLNDLSHHCKNKDIIKQVEDAALNFVTIYDPNLEDESIHAVALKRYQAWIS